ncbi:hypothetical protein JVT61DRAFT_7932 [Boletus reticuloceps]|uniref:Peptidase M3A/M3B catalytic domain-containing protein n=1 Tax=Boletus reticuloceps TaxID=495285 RepID=A0A8I2YI87_9AGAM|nr:hypothetical protein JVT61DRAFT_7932 [Boletus reticuloceps]
MDADTFEQGFDSLSSTFLRNCTIGPLAVSSRETIQAAASQIIQNIVFVNPTLRLLDYRPSASPSGAEMKVSSTSTMSSAPPPPPEIPPQDKQPESQPTTTASQWAQDAAAMDTTPDQPPEETWDVIPADILALSTDKILTRIRLIENDVKVMKSETLLLQHEQSVMKEKIRDNGEKINRTRSTYSGSNSWRSQAMHGTYGTPFAVWEMNAQYESGFIRYRYLDLFPHEGKYSHAAVCGLLPGYELPEGKRHHPLTAMVANLAKPTPERPALMRHDDYIVIL